jgi:integrase/recombinase XerD
VVLRFLDYLEQHRGNAVRSHNIRLSALRSFFRFVALRDPESIAIATRVLAIPLKREDTKLVGYLTGMKRRPSWRRPTALTGSVAATMPSC